MQLDQAQKTLSALCDDYLLQKIDLDEFRQRRANLLDELSGREPEAMFDTLTREMPSTRSGGDVSEPTMPSFVGANTMEIKPVSVKAQRQRTMRLAAVAVAVAAVLVGGLTFLWMSKSEPAEAEGAEVDVSPAQALERFASDSDWNVADINEFIRHWQNFSVQQRVDLRLKPEFKNVVRRVQSQLAMAGSDDQTELATALRELVREIE